MKVLVGRGIARVKKVWIGYDSSSGSYPIMAMSNCCDARVHFSPTPVEEEGWPEHWFCAKCATPVGGYWRGEDGSMSSSINMHYLGADKPRLKTWAAYWLDIPVEDIGVEIKRS